MLSRIFRLRERAGPVSSATSLSDSNQMLIVLEIDIRGVSDRETWRAISQIRIFMTQSDAHCSSLRFGRRDAGKPATM
jgi:hypothetical protein